MNLSSNLWLNELSISLESIAMVDFQQNNMFVQQYVNS